jgi:hypothetical protein
MLRQLVAKCRKAVTTRQTMCKDTRLQQQQCYCWWQHLHQQYSCTACSCVKRIPIGVMYASAVLFVAASSPGDQCLPTLAFAGVMPVFASSSTILL